MATRSGARDPRGFVTPDAFEVSPALLGMPLALPRRRLAALFVDLGVAGFISLVTSDFHFLLGVGAAVLFIRAGFKRTPVKGGVWGRAMRLSVGCLGLIIAGITMAVVGALLGEIDRTTDAAFDGEEVRVPSLVGTLPIISEGVEWARTDSREDAQTAADALATRGVELGLTRAELRALLMDLVRDDAPWRPDAESILDSAISGAYDGRGETAADSSVVATTDTLPFSAAARDSLAALEREVQRWRTEARDLEGALERARASLVNRDQEGGFFSWLLATMDELGFGAGWFVLYLTVLLSWWNGQTVGKRLMGIRVVRLDGEPINWWVAFERAGGYAAGLATGMLGFAQIYWDANRQGIHDRIVGTVVVRDGAEKVTEWRDAL
ncbi:MAG: RDD family protein [Gemmatimonadota bacterium]|nr:RDD family protein [Gemmatimonadota bacterium]MDH5760374.1 RDD family protein [Gemmatimonadota bacterium]